MQTKSPTGTAALVLEIEMLVRGKPKLTKYRVRFLDPDPEVARKPAIRLTKTDGSDSYEIHRDEFGTWFCTCGDYGWRREKKDPGGCKHLRSLKAVGLLKDRS